MEIVGSLVWVLRGYNRLAVYEWDFTDLMLKPLVGGGPGNVLNSCDNLASSTNTIDNWENADINDFHKTDNARTTASIAITLTVQIPVFGTLTGNQVLYGNIGGCDADVIVELLPAAIISYTVTEGTIQSFTFNH